MGHGVSSRRGGANICRPTRGRAGTSPFCRPITISAAMSTTPSSCSTRLNSSRWGRRFASSPGFSLAAPSPVASVESFRARGAARSACTLTPTYGNTRNGSRGSAPRRAEPAQQLEDPAKTTHRSRARSLRSSTSTRRYLSRHYGTGRGLRHDAHPQISNAAFLRAREANASRRTDDIRGTALSGVWGRFGAPPPNGTTVGVC